MGYLQKQLAVVAGTPSPEDDYWYTNYPASGSVNPVTVLQIPMVWACVRVLAETLAQVPLGVYQDMGEEGKRKATNHPVYSVLHKRPNAWQTSVEWREMMMGHLVLRGNAYCYIAPGRRGAVDQLIPLNPDRMVKVDQLPDRRLRYTYNDPKQGNVVYLQEEIFHLRGLSADGITGMSIVDVASSTFNLNLSLTGHADKFFRNAARPGGVIEHPSHFKDREMKEAFRKDWRKFSDGELGETAVLEHGMHWTQLGMTQEDAQFLETFQELDVNLARLFRMPLHLVQDLRKATFSNIEQQSLEFVMYTMTPWFVLWEQAMDRDLIIAPNYFTRFNMNGLLRGTTQERFNAYATAINAGFMSREEVRILEDMNPKPAVGQLYVPMNMTPEDQGAMARAATILHQVAAREVRREVAVLKAEAVKAVDVGAFRVKAAEFYEDQVARVRENFATDVHVAEAWARLSFQKLEMAGSLDDVAKIINTWEADKALQMAKFFSLVKKTGEE